MRLILTLQLMMVEEQHPLKQGLKPDNNDSRSARIFC